MEKFVLILIRFRILIISITIVLLIAGIFLIPATNVNYDLADYLPDDSMTKEAINVMDKEFGSFGNAQVMVKNVTMNLAKDIKDRLISIPGIKSITWLDDVTDITLPEDFIPQEFRDIFYKNGNALFQINFTTTDYSPDTGETIDKIEIALTEYDHYIAGTAYESNFVRNLVTKEVLGILIVILPLCLLILFLASSTWIEPLIYILVIGIGVVLNMGSNFIFNNVSFITHSMTAVLQLAISLDYSLFIFHRYMQERESGNDFKRAIVLAVKNSFASVFSSALTTVAGFLALIFMSYRIGADMGIVLAKGILFSFAAVIILMPIMIYLFRNIIEKTRHRPLISKYKILSRFTIKFRHAILVVGVFVLIISFMAQHNNSFIYGDTSATGKSGDKAGSLVISETFGVYNPLVLLVPKGDIPREIEITGKLEDYMYINNIQSLVTSVDPFIPNEMIPREVYDNFVSENYSRIILMLSMNEESPQAFETVEYVKSTASDIYGDSWYLAGKASSIYDIKESVEDDSTKVMWFSILAVFIIVMITTKSLAIPVILIAVIQGSIWINMGIPYFQGNSLIFIGYMIISAIQLGATIDYAILFSGRYMEHRKFKAPVDAAVAATSSSGVAITVSAMILAAAGFTEGILSDIPSISEIGILLGRGAALSGIMVLFVLPGLMVLFDKIILITTYKAKINAYNPVKEGIQNEKSEIKK